MKKLSVIKKQYILHWILLLSVAEFLIFFLSHLQILFLLLIAGGFFVGFLLRLLQVYPGRREPLFLDLFSCCLALLLSALASWLKPSNAVILVLLPVLVVPHIYHIITHRV